MRTIWLNFGAAWLWWQFGWGQAAWLVPMSVVLLLYSLTYDWHEDARHYRDALAELDRFRF